MWRVENNTPYAAGRAWGRDKDGVHEWIVAVKATFDVLPDGALRLSSEQPPPLLAAEFNGAPGASSVRFEADLVGSKPTTDVVVNGTAYAPGGEPSAEFHVALRVGEVNKRLKVVGNRRWEDGVFGLRKSAVEPVAAVPVVYERSRGGSDLSHPDPKRQKFDPRNPVGCGMLPREGEPLPNFEYPGWRGERNGPAGFGPLASFWSPRRELAGTYDEAWQEGRYPLPPEDWDPRSLLCSPADQRPAAHLRGGEVVELENLTPGGYLRFGLPRVHLRYRTEIDGRVEDHEDHLSTVIIEPDHPRVSLVWQSVLPVRTDGDYLEATHVSIKRQLR